MLTMAWDLLNSLFFVAALVIPPLIGMLMTMSRPPSLPMLLNFRQKFGPNAVYDLQEMLEGGMSQREICEKFRMDKAQLSRYVNTFFKRKFPLHEELKAHLIREAQLEHDRLNPTLRLVGKAEERAKERSL